MNMDKTFGILNRWDTNGILFLSECIIESSDIFDALHSQFLSQVYLKRPRDASTRCSRV